LEVAEYTALQMKKAVVGHGKAAKHQVQEMVMRLLKLPGLPGPDASDALGLAIMHAQVAKTTQAIQKVTTTNARKSAAFKDGRHY
ncbi:MAG: crossover junction endodeoxyribonuclease RuvC, partial [Burkholderiaceae bacterium]